MRLPEVAQELRELAAVYGINRLAQLADEIRRRPSRRGPRTSARMTPALATSIRLFARANPHLSNQQVASAYNVNSGRVSEVLKGKRA